MRGAWLVLCACALPLARAERDVPEIRVTPMPADPELNAKWLEEFRRDLLRDAYDDETSPKSPSSTHRTTASLVYRTHASETTSEATRPGADHTTEKVPLPGFRSLGAVSTRRTTASSPARYRDDDDDVGHSSGESGPLPDAWIRRRATLENIGAGHKPGRLPPNAQSGPLVERLSGKPPSRSPDDAASRELGISRRDLHGGRRYDSITDIELDARRQPFLQSMRELDDQMIPVVVPHAANNDNQLDHNRKSRKRLWRPNNEYEHKLPYIIDQNGVKRYRVHTDARERFFNQFGEDEPGLKEEWGSSEFDREMQLKENRNRQRSDENLAQNDDDQENREDSGSHDDGISVSSSNELNVSEYHQENVRSRYIQDERPEREYAQRFSARRDAALLADGLASSKKPCNCETEHPPIVPEL